MYFKLNNIEKTLGNFNLQLDISINKGELVTLLGPSGCGKTTALRIAAGFITPDKGDVIINDQPITNTPPYKRNIGIVFQNYALFPHLNVEENISYGLKNRKLKKPQIKEEVDFILKSLQLSDYHKRDINSLSGGEKQRVALGRSLAIKPQLLLLDEPLSALDADLRKKLRYEIKSIQREFSITTLYVTHDQEEALAVSDRVALLSAGRLQQYSTPYELYSNPVNRFSGEFIGESNIITNGKDTIFFRPESLKKGHSEKGINFSGKIIQKEYLGNITRAILETDNNNRLKIISYDHSVEDKYHIDLADVIHM